MAGSNSPRTLLDALDAAADTPFGACFLNRRGEAVPARYADLRQGALRFAARLTGIERFEPGFRVGVIARTGPEFYHAFFGCMIAGATPAVLPPPPLFANAAAYRQRIGDMARAARLDALWTEGLRRDDFRSGSPVPLLDVTAQSNDPACGAAKAPARPADPDALAFIQFSSGATSLPKAIFPTHAQILFNAHAMLARLGCNDAPPGSGCTSWLPFHHDMGLVGCLINTIVRPMNVTWLTPEGFVLKPQLWLETISRTRSFASATPCFGLARCLEIPDADLPTALDMGRLRRLVCGAERLDPEVLESFARRFAPYGFDARAFMPAYGLAEAGLAVTMAEPESGARARRFSTAALLAGKARADADGQALISNGAPLPGYQVRITYGGGAAAPDGHVGRVLVRGGSIGANTVSGEPSEIFYDGWLDTGDDGFLADGELYITGRRKDVLIVSGVNYALPHIEAVASAGLPETIVCAAIALPDPHGGPERLMLAAERGRKKSAVSDQNLAAAIKENIGAGIGLVPFAVTILNPGQLPRTSSGKIRKGQVTEDASRHWRADEPCPSDCWMCSSMNRRVSETASRAGPSIRTRFTSPRPFRPPMRR